MVDSFSILCFGSSKFSNQLSDPLLCFDSSLSSLLTLNIFFDVHKNDESNFPTWSLKPLCCVTDQVVVVLCKPNFKDEAW